jgi:hypothetical protein
MANDLTMLFLQCVSCAVLLIAMEPKLLQSLAYQLSSKGPSDWKVTGFGGAGKHKPKKVPASMICPQFVIISWRFH